jgi:trimethylamine:corrinoid methyltransferase-like protein
MINNGLDLDLPEEHAEHILAEKRKTEFLQTDHEISLDCLIQALNKELQWCYQNTHLANSKQSAMDFIAGVEQAKDLIIKVAMIYGEEPVAKKVTGLAEALKSITVSE